MMPSANAETIVHQWPVGANVQGPVPYRREPALCPFPPRQRRIMNLAKFLSRLPLLANWMNKTLADHAAQARPVANFGFSRLPFFFSADLLANTKVIVVGRVPAPPFAAIGLPEFSAFGNSDYSGITFKDTYFLQISQAANESVHFHELVHVVQWAHLGVERFLSAYAAGLEENGYRNNPMEAMAYELQDYFDLTRQPLDMEASIRSRLNKLYR